jgi:hypothetical protein
MKKMIGKGFLIFWSNPNGYKLVTISIFFASFEKT